VRWLSNLKFAWAGCNAGLKKWTLCSCSLFRISFFSIHTFSGLFCQKYVLSHFCYSQRGHFLGPLEAHIWELRGNVFYILSIFISLLNCLLMAISNFSMQIHENKWYFLWVSRNFVIVILGNQVHNRCPYDCL